MVDLRDTCGTYVSVIPGARIIGELMRQGGTIYRKSGTDVLLIVPNGLSHSAAWNVVMGR